MCVCADLVTGALVSASVMSVSGRKLLGEDERGARMCMGILASRACLRGAVGCCIGDTSLALEGG